VNQISKISLGLWVHCALVALSLLIFVATFSWPLLSTPGFESANLYVLILGPFLALAAACNTRSRSIDFRMILRRELGLLLLHIALIFGLLLTRSFAVTSCSIGSGIGTFFLILTPALLLNTIIGSIIACVISRLKIKILVWFIFYISYFVIKFYFWWHDATFRFLSDLSILLTSDLVEGTKLTPAVMTFRLGTLCICLALIAFGLAWWSKSRGRINYAQKPTLYFMFFLAMGACAVLLHTQSLKAIGKNKAQLKKDYSLIRSSQNISVHANPDLNSQGEVKALLEEALLYQERLRKKLGMLSSEPIIIWLHRDDEQKALYTGAKNVHFAQPKHREIHVSSSETPHPVLGHELAHIYVGEYSTTLWGLPGRWLVIPNMALTEGLAMILTPELALTNNLDLMQQAQALQQAGVGVDIKTLFSMNPLDFSKSNFRASYIFSGAFLNFYLENIAKQDRPHALQKIAQAGSLGALFNSQEELRATLAQFSSRLAKAVPAYAILWAERNFGETGILTADCTNIQENPTTRFWQALLNLHTNDAIKALGEISSQMQIPTALEAIKLLLHKRESAHALELILATKNLIKKSHDTRLIEIYNYELQALIQQRRLSEALDLIKIINPMALNLSAHRQLIIQTELLLEASQSVDDSYAQLLDSTQKLLLASVDQTALELQFAYALGKYSGPETLALKFAKYLYARMLMRANKYQEALVFLESILDTSIILPTNILDEALAMKAECLLALKKYSEAAQDFSYLLTRTMSPAARQSFGDKLDRIKFKEEK